MPSAGKTLQSIRRKGIPGRSSSVYIALTWGGFAVDMADEGDWPNDMGACIASYIVHIVGPHYCHRIPTGSTGKGRVVVQLFLGGVGVVEFGVVDEEGGS